jgi:hypothetical protein
VLQQAGSGIGDGDRTRASIDERDAKLALQGSDVMRDDRLGVPESDRRG